MKRILVWGISSFYDKIVNVLNAGQEKGSIEILAYICSDSLSFSNIDNKPIIKPFEINNYIYDYIIVASSMFGDIQNISTSLGIRREQLIKGDVCLIPFFNFERYFSIIEKNISLVTEFCYGGFILHNLGLKFNTPFINTRINLYNYMKLLSNFENYIASTLRPYKKNWIKDKRIWYDNPSSWNYPIACLDGGGGKVLIELIHHFSFEEFEVYWNKRVKRFNFSSTLVLCVIKSDDMAKVFDKLPIKNKVGFYFKQLDLESIVCLNEWNNEKVKLLFAYSFENYVMSICRMNYSSSAIDFFKLLNGEKDFIRKI